jgi:hypothetical protein
MAIGGLILRAIKRKAQSAGIDLDVGEIPAFEVLDPTTDDPTKPAKVIAHAVGRIADKTPGVKRINRHLEGIDAKAGIGADLLTVAYEIAIRNQEPIESILKNTLDSLRQQREEKARDGATRTSRWTRKDNTQKED